MLPKLFAHPVSVAHHTVLNDLATCNRQALQLVAYSLCSWTILVMCVHIVLLFIFFKPPSRIYFLFCVDRSYATLLEEEK